ncbi:MAG: tyrosine-protein phosphatase [archaeon]|nr:tyrosine-protein phosphatase [archaeon]
MLKPSSTGIRAKTKFSRTEWNQSETQIKFLLRDYQNTVITSELQKKEINPEELAQMKILQQADGVDFDYDHESALYPSIDSAGFGKLYLISLVGARFQLAIVRKSSKRQVVRAGLSADTPQAQRRALCAPIFDRPDGLSVLYQLLVKHSFQEFCLFFNTLLDIQFPIAYFCNHGKDRTGMCTALLLSLCGVDRSTIIDNYALSDSLLLPIKQIVDFEMTDAGQDPAIMSRTPPEAMAFILDYIDRIYGGVPEYLKHIGFGYRKQHTLRTKLVDVDHIDQSSFKFTGLLLIIEKATNLPVSALRSTVGMSSLFFLHLELLSLLFFFRFICSSQTFEF